MLSPTQQANENIMDTIERVTQEFVQQTLGPLHIDTIIRQGVEHFLYANSDIVESAIQQGVVEVLDNNPQLLAGALQAAFEQAWRTRQSDEGARAHG